MMRIGVTMKIYTKTGDKGTTRLVDGACVEKFNPRVEAYGTVDELNSAIGVLVSLLVSNPKGPESEKFKSISIDLLKIQHWLFNAGSLLATEKVDLRSQLPQITDLNIQWVEKSIDQMTAELPILKNFILPGGDLTSSQAHMCRTICRRAERRTAEVSLLNDKLNYKPSDLNTQANPLNVDDGNHDDPVLIFLNRLSDYFFTLARYLNLITRQIEITWNKETNA